jgi:uncharacterized heparinase superfamily protein
MLRQTYRLMKRTRDLLSETGDHVATLTGGHIPHFVRPANAPHAKRGFVCCPPDVWQGDISRGHDMMGFVSKTPVAGLRTLMSPAGLRDLRLDFHTFDWVHDLRAVGSNEARTSATTLINAWVYASPQANALIGNAECTTRRLLRLIGCYAFYAPALNDDTRTALYTSVLDQSRDLKRQLKMTHDRTDQFFAALGIAAVALATGDPSTGTHLKTLHKTIDRIILNDGGPSTRRPDDLPEILRGLIDLRHIIDAARLPLPAFIAHAIDRVVPALQFFRLGDNKLAAFHGGRAGQAAPITDIIRHTRVQAGTPATLSHTGFERLATDTMIAIIDAGRMGPGHHASTTAFELSVGKARVIVGCGQHETDPTWQELLAATSAHSTLTLDHQDNMTGKDPYDVDITRAYVPGGETVTITHTGYMARNGFTHTRALTASPNPTVLVGVDTVATSIPPLNPVDITVRFHLHPSVTPTLVDDGGRVELDLHNGTWCSFECDDGTLCIEDSIYLAETGRPQKTKQIVIKHPIYSAQKTISWRIQA